MNPSTKTRAWLPALAACTALLGCQQRVIDPGREAGGSDEIDTRMAMDAKGRPLAGARIALVSAGDSTGKLAALSSTGSNGQYPSFNVPDGQYSATLRDAQDSLGKFLDTLQITGGKAKVGRDTLLALGKIRGVVRLVGGETPATVIMSLYGTDIAANVRKDGSFEIDLVPGGLFTLMGSTSLDGYGTLLRRLQLRDGQDLVIPDTLSLPVTGLLAPANIWVESDTATGDVRVRWNKVDHPNRMGYVLEKVENGVVTQSQFLTDTVWKDSLRGYWEGLPLLGPWPSREAVYRVSTRPLSGKVDSRSVAQSFVAKAPEWTKRVDSVKVTMTTDSLADVTSLRWNAPPHPDLRGWHVERTVNGQMDCSIDVFGNSWSDDRCRSSRKVILDSTRGGGPILRLEGEFSRVMKFQLKSIRKLGREEELGAVQREVLGENVVTWRDSGLSGIPNGTMLRAIGNWIFWQTPEGNPVISRDGQNWERVPASKIDYPNTWDPIWQIFGFGDSVVLVRGKMEQKGLKAFVRKSEGVWEERLLKFDTTITYVIPLGFYREWPQFNISTRESSYIVVALKDTLIVIARQDADHKFVDVEGLEIPEANNRDQWVEYKGERGKFGGICLRDSGSILQEWAYDWAIGNDELITPTVFRDGFFVLHALPEDAELVFMSRNAPPKLVNPPVPGPKPRGWDNSYAMIGDEIWQISGGRLWKGKLNLPKGQ